MKSGFNLNVQLVTICLFLVLFLCFVFCVLVLVQLETPLKTHSKYVRGQTMLFFSILIQTYLIAIKIDKR